MLTRDPLCNSSYMNKTSYLAALSPLFLALSAFGQAGPGTGQIAGTVKDPDMAVVPGVQVVATKQADECPRHNRE